jgi:hypothetical protein
LGIGAALSYGWPFTTAAAKRFDLLVLFTGVHPFAQTLVLTLWPAFIA